MRFLADENISAKLVKFLAEAGHNVRFTNKGSKNSELIALAKKENRVLVTHDRDFLNILLYPPERYAGIVLLLVHPPKLANEIAVLKELLDKFSFEELSGKLFKLTEEGMELIKEPTLA